MRIKEKKEIKAIHSKDLEELLTKTDQLVDFQNNKISCISCEITVTKENIGRMKFVDGKFEFTCSNPSCSSKIGI